MPAGRVAKTEFTWVSWVKATPGIDPSAMPASMPSRRRRAIAFARPALRRYRSPSRSASSWAETNRIFEASCIWLFRR